MAKVRPETVSACAALGQATVVFDSTASSVRHEATESDCLVANELAAMVPVVAAVVAAVGSFGC